MSFYIPEYILEQFIEEDVNPVDLTSHILGMDRVNARITYRPRHSMTVCCTEETDKMFQKLNLKVIHSTPTGNRIQKDETFFSAEGRGDHIHMAWRNGIRMFESFCGIATRTSKFVDIVKSVNPSIMVATTRKTIPGTKKLTVKAVMAGGAFPHRLGLSESVLIFNHHINLYGGKEKIIADFEKLKNSAKEKHLGIESDHYGTAMDYVKAGFELIQLDKLNAGEVKRFSEEARSVNPRVVIIAAGNITIENAGEYARSNPDIIVTTSLYHGKSADINVTIERI
jgi:molybdenum transport protein